MSLETIRLPGKKIFSYNFWARYAFGCRLKLLDQQIIHATITSIPFFFKA